MKKVFTITSLLLLTLCSVYAQTNSSFKSVDTYTKIKNAKRAFAKSTESYVKNSDFTLWEQDSLTTISNNTLYFQRPAYWAPVTGFLVSYFMDTPIPLSMHIDTYNDTSALIHIDTNQTGTDIATVVATNQRAYSFSANYKFNGSPYAANVDVYATKYDSLSDSTYLVGVGSASITENTTGEFQTISSDIYYLDENVVPDTFIIFASYFEGAVGSLFIVDDVQLSYTVTGVKYDKNQKINIYPNPAKNFIALNSETLNGELMKVEICSIDGKLMKVVENYLPNQSIGISDLNAGMYILKLSTDKEVISKKIMVE